MAVISCKLNMGLQDQEVFIRNKKYNNKPTVETYKMPIQDIAEFIAKTNDVDEAYLSGPTPFIQKIKDDTREKEIQKYSKVKTKFILI